MDSSGNNLFVSYFETLSGSYNETYVLHWNGSLWSEAGTGAASGGGLSNNGANSYGYRSISKGFTNNPAVIWYDNSSGDYEIYLKQWQ